MPWLIKGTQLALASCFATLSMSAAVAIQCNIRDLIRDCLPKLATAAASVLLKSALARKTFFDKDFGEVKIHEKLKRLAIEPDDADL
jgi:hypothetical protein